jgi:hypothetical protein
MLVCDCWVEKKGATLGSFITTAPPPKENDAEGEGFPKVKNCLLIFRGRAARLTTSQRKREL